MATSDRRAKQRVVWNTGGGEERNSLVVGAFQKGFLRAGGFWEHLCIGYVNLLLHHR